MRDFYVERERIIREVSRVRGPRGPDDQVLADLIVEFTTQRRVRAGVGSPRRPSAGSGNKPLCHPIVVPLIFSYEVLMPGRDPDQRIIVHRPADEESQTALDRLAAAPQAP
ncbi:hypothetical protein AB0C34_20605 [Nocardia sp. NPDC049220]|uniref:MmyB family transcriptional regulator n=1 Tax=Nocardia sp. NPDC049220 TaxID=3155273 RepID=UPI0033C890BE